MSSCEGRYGPCVRVPSENSLAPSGPQRRSYQTQSLQLCLRNSPCNSSRERAWQTTTVSLQVAKLPSTPNWTAHSSTGLTWKHKKCRMVAEGLQGSHQWLIPTCWTHWPVPNTDPLNYLTQGSVLQTLTMGFGLGTTTVAENGKTALPNLLLHNRLSWI